MSRVQDVILRDTRANQPTPTAGQAGMLYCVTDEADIVERWSGSAWEAFGAAGTGSGDVVGPASAVDERVAVFDSTTGKLLKDGGATIAEIVADAVATATGSAGDVIGPATNGDNALARFNGADSKTIQGGTVYLEDDGRITGLTAPTSGTDATTKTYVDEAIAAAVPSGASQDSFIVSGGQVAWESDYVFRVSAASYYIGGVLYASSEDTVTLAAADATEDRIDVLALNTAGEVVAITGEHAAQPSEPDVDPATQLKLGIVFVAASSSAPTISSVILYADQAGGPAEWNWSTSGTGFNVGSTTNPHAGTKCIEGTNAANGAYALGQVNTGTIDPNAYDRLVFYIRSKSAWNSGRVLRVQWFNAGVAKGTPITVGAGYWGFDTSITAGYQLISVPMLQFAIPAGVLVNQLRITDSGGSIGFYLDDISLQVGGSTATVTSGITQEQADARYAALVHATRHAPGGADALPVSAASRLMGRGSGAGAGAVQEITIGSGLSLSGVNLTATSTGDVVGPSSAEGDNLVVFDATTGKLIKDSGKTVAEVISDALASAGTGDVVGPASSTDNAIVRFDSTGGKTLQNSGVTISDADAVAGAASVAIGAALVAQTKLTVAGQFHIVGVDNGNSGATKTIDWSAGNEQVVTMTAACEFTFSNPANPGRFVLELIQGGSGSYAVTWPGTVKWGTKGAPTLSTTVGKKDLFTFLWDGTDYLGCYDLGF